MQKKESHCKLQTRARATGVEQPLGGAPSLLAVARLSMPHIPQDLLFTEQSTIIPSWAWPVQFIPIHVAVSGEWAEVNGRAFAHCVRPFATLPAQDRSSLTLGGAVAEDSLLQCCTPSSRMKPMTNAGEWLVQPPPAQVVQVVWVVRPPEWFVRPAPGPGSRSRRDTRLRRLSNKHTMALA